MTREELRQALSFYRDLGVTDLYRQGPLADGVPSGPGSESAQQNSGSQAALLSRDREEAAAGAELLIPLAPSGDSLEQIQRDIGPDCRRCRLCEQRSKIVFGVGNSQARLVFVGEGPGADEDAQGIPFVGRAGQLLTQMIDNTAAREGIPIRRADVYICNVVKCRPPENRTPLPDEMEICGEFLFRQLMAIRPKAIVALGSTAAKALLGTKDGVTRLRGHWHKWRDTPLIVTYHPSYLLRPYNQNAKRESWEDLKKALHFVYD
jgi:uracil-DNA glycosylase